MSQSSSESEYISSQRLEGEAGPQCSMLANLSSPRYATATPKGPFKCDVRNDSADMLRDFDSDKGEGSKKNPNSSRCERPLGVLWSAVSPPPSSSLPLSVDVIGDCTPNEGKNGQTQWPLAKSHSLQRTKNGERTDGHDIKLRTISKEAEERLFSGGSLPWFNSTQNHSPQAEYG